MILTRQFDSLTFPSQIVHMRQHHSPRIIVIGGGHAGIEAACAAAGMGAQVTFLTQNPEAIGRMSCNPAIGGIGKGQIVREIDALGGQMGYIADRSGIQFKVLNRRKGPAVQSSRCQSDRGLYQYVAQEVVHSYGAIDVIADGVQEISAEAGRCRGVVGVSGARYVADAVVLCAGTFLQAITHTGAVTKPEGRYGEAPSNGLSDQLRSFGFAVGRLKTGTPPRLNGSTIDYSVCEPQPGDDSPRGFSRRRPLEIKNSAMCWLTYTNADTHALIGDNFHLSPLYNGQITGVGPRYCPSIEDKVKKFSDKPRHQLFLEPEGLGTDEIYINGFSTSLPAETQIAALRTIPALRNVEVTRAGYAVEYDFFPPTQLHSTLETKPIAGLFFAGQINGTSGYEEAAGQGFVAGVNAVLAARADEPFILGRDEAYIGVMIDDLVTLGVDEPYRMFTSRAEHRLRLREDNAPRRLSHYGHRLGLIDQTEYDHLQLRWRRTDDAIASFEKTSVSSARIPFEGLKRKGNATLADLLRIPKVQFSDLYRFDPALPWIDSDVAEEIEIAVKYDGYIDRQERQVELFRRLEAHRIPDGFSYTNLRGLRHESVEKFERIRPRTLGQASRIPGITSADLNLLMIRLRTSAAA